MQKNKLIGSLIFLIGIFFILNSFSGITGFVVAENIGKDVSGIIGFVFVVAGVLVFMSGREQEEGKLVMRIIRTRDFEKAIKKGPKKQIENAISKIGTGLAKEESLRYRKGKKSIRVSKGGRIIYSQEGDGICLENYLPDHKY